MQTMQFPEALTFDDIMLLPSYSEVLPTEIITKSFFARDIHLGTPIISAAMDTVTEHKVARIMAQEGGLGIIHRNSSPVEQAREVEKVKKYESGMIVDPITLSPESKVSEALGIMREYSIGGVPITVNKKLVGMLTNRDLRFETNLAQPIANIMTKENLVTVSPGTTLEKAKEILQKYKIEKLPVVDKNGDLVGLITIKDIQKSQAYPNATKDSQGRLIVGAALGVGPQAIERAAALIEAKVDILVVDTAHGHSKNVIWTVKELSKKYKHVVLVAGNVVTSEGAQDLYDAGADVVKVGVGPGSICTTRIVAGVGVPQITAIIETAKIARKLKKTLISDGGIKYSGDITKALAVGADAVMVGGVFAGCDESPGEVILYQGRSYKVYRGMGSLGALATGSKDRYGQADVSEFDKLVPEGIEGKVPYKGSLSAIVHQLVGGVRSGMGYVGAKTVPELQEKAKFVKLTLQGLRESHVHDVMITKEAPNYRVE
ncbi:MAG: IMP dehydrogenase [Pseudomonadota bacterium]|nr:IMP dehydrogenase [Pseudomonadota bacterium]